MQFSLCMSRTTKPIFPDRAWLARFRFHINTLHLRDEKPGSEISTLQFEQARRLLPALREALVFVRARSRPPPAAAGATRGLPPAATAQRHHAPSIA